MEASQDIFRNIDPRRLTEENNADTWIGRNREMVSSLNGFPAWDNQTIQLISDHFKAKLNELTDEGLESACIELKKRWAGWVAEASVQRVFSNLGIQLTESADLDKHGVDFMRTEHNPKDRMSHYLFFQVKAKASVDAGIFMFETMNAAVTDLLRDAIPVSAFFNDQKLRDTQPGGRTHGYCVRMSRKLWEELNQRVMKKNGVGLPADYTASVYIGGIGVGMRSEQRGVPGWWTLMQNANDKNSPLHSNVKTALIDILQRPTKQRL
ncbi:MAG: hypothetical protein M3Q81_00360 [bacterium]|nr:hypothetical protein [bacterium]